MRTQDVVLKRVDAVRIAEMTTSVGSFRTAEIGPAIQALYPQLMQNLSRAGIQPTGYAISYYEPVEPEDRIVIHAGITVSSQPLPDEPFDIVELPAVSSAATLIHHGPMDDVEASYQDLANWIGANGYRTSGFAREFYLDYDPDDTENGVTELQIPVEKA